MLGSGGWIKETETVTELDCSMCHVFHVLVNNVIHIVLKLCVEADDGLIWLRSSGM